MSPFIHDRLFSLTGHKPEYSVLDVPSLTQALPALRTLDGFNITIPHKSDIIPLLDGIDEKAKLFGSVNTVRVRRRQNDRLHNGRCRLQKGPCALWARF